MSSTTYTSFKTFVTTLSLTVNSESIQFPSNEVVMIFAQSYENNVFPHTKKMALLYAGSFGDCEEYFIKYMKEAFDDGIIQSPLFSTGNNFVQYINKQLSKNKTLTLTDINELKLDHIHGVSFSQKEWELLTESRKVNYKPCSQYNEVRYQHPLNSVIDLKNIITDLMSIRFSYEEYKWWYATPYIIREKILPITSR